MCKYKKKNSTIRKQETESLYANKQRLLRWFIKEKFRVLAIFPNEPENLFSCESNTYASSGHL